MQSKKADPTIGATCPALTNENYDYHLSGECSAYCICAINQKPCLGRIIGDFDEQSSRFVGRAKCTIDAKEISKCPVYGASIETLKVILEERIHCENTQRLNSLKMKSIMKNENHCPHCGASLKMHWHRLSKGLVTTLLKFRAACIAHRAYKIHVPKDVTLTQSEYNNFQKLRYHGLVTKARKGDGNRDGGMWILTTRGGQFCRNEIVIPIKVQTFRNKISSRSDEKADIYTIMEIIGDTEPFWDTKTDFTYELADI